MKKSRLLNSVRATIRRHRMLSPGDGVLACVSGGPDSISLLHILNDLKEELHLSLACAHVNHSLRGEESDQEEDMVREASKGLGIPFTSRQVDVKAHASRRRLSTQMAARELRYQFFTEASLSSGRSKIALGHTMDDVVETILLRILRGTGTAGLAGIPPVRDLGKGLTLIRPLIETWRGDVEKFLSERRIRYALDPTNIRSAYLRNRIRNLLIPQLERDYNPSIRERLASMAELLREDSRFLEEEAESIFDRAASRDERGISLDLSKFIPLSQAMKRRLLLKALNMMEQDTGSISFRHVDALLNLTDKEGSVHRVQLPGRLTAWKVYDRLLLRSHEEVRPAPYERELPIPGRVEIPEAGLVMRASICHADNSPLTNAGDMTALMDRNKLGAHLTVRSRLPGDRIVPLGMKGEKKLKELLIDQKVPWWWRERLPLVVSGGLIIWAVGVRLSDTVKVTPSTRVILRIDAEPL